MRSVLRNELHTNLKAYATDMLGFARFGYSVDTLGKENFVEDLYPAAIGYKKEKKCGRMRCWT